MKIMVIGAHPADPIDLAGGTIINHINNGDEVIAVAITNGFNSHVKDEWVNKKVPEWERKEKNRQYLGWKTLEQYLLENKRQEFADVCNFLNIKNEMFNIGDAPLQVSTTLISSIMCSIRNHKPDIVITHHPNEYAHFDHSACGKAVCMALKKAVQDRGSNKYWVPTVYFFGVQFRPEQARLGYVPQSPDVLVELKGNTVIKKIQAMKHFESQGLNDDKLLISRMNSMESEMGRADGLKYSEGFILYYPLKTNLLFTNPENKQFYKIKKEK